MFCLRSRYSSGKEKTPYLLRHAWLSQAADAEAWWWSGLSLRCLAVHLQWVERLAGLCGAVLWLSFRKASSPSTVHNRLSKYLPEP